MAVTENKYQLGKQLKTRNFCRMLEMALLSWTSVSVTRRKLLLSGDDGTP